MNQNTFNIQFKQYDRSPQLGYIFANIKQMDPSKINDSLKLLTMNTLTCIAEQACLEKKFDLTARIIEYIGSDINLNPSLSPNEKDLFKWALRVLPAYNHVDSRELSEKINQMAIHVNGDEWEKLYTGLSNGTFPTHILINPEFLKAITPSFGKQISLIMLHNLKAAIKALKNDSEELKCNFFFNAILDAKFWGSSVPFMALQLNYPTFMPEQISAWINESKNARFKKQ